MAKDKNGFRDQNSHCFWDSGTNIMGINMGSVMKEYTPLVFTKSVDSSFRAF